MTISGVILTPLKRIPNPSGDVYHGMRRSDPGFQGFGEAYFSTINHKAIKGWKRHREMTLNLIVPIGAVRFVLYDERPNSATQGSFSEVTLSVENYQRLTVPPGIWMGFQGISERENLVLNVANIEHSPVEADSRALGEISFDWL